MNEPDEKKGWRPGELVLDGPEVEAIAYDRGEYVNHIVESTDDVLKRLDFLMKNPSVGRAELHACLDSVAVRMHHRGEAEHTIRTYVTAVMISWILLSTRDTDLREYGPYADLMAQRFPVLTLKAMLPFQFSLHELLMSKRVVIGGNPRSSSHRGRRE